MRDDAGLMASLASPPPGLDGAVVDHLRLTDRFAPLLRRALAKRARLAGLRPPAPGPALDAALAWFAERSGWDAIRPAPGIWTDAAEYEGAVWREYVFLRAEDQKL
jgi:hypothetical protein